MNHTSMKCSFPPRLIAALLLLYVAAAFTALHAQTYSDVTITDGLSVEGSSSSYLYLRSNGVLIGPGNSGVTLNAGDLPASGSSKSGLLWHPGKMALLVGSFPTSESSIGSNSIALNGAASGSSSFATGEGSASGGSSFASGMGYATGWNCFAHGEFASATGTNSTAIGIVAQATGSYSTAIGIVPTASGANSTALGFGTHAGAYASCAVGAYNVGSFTRGGDTQWVMGDPIFEVGNGTSIARSNALTVYKNGNAAVQGVLTVAPSSDIPMYTGN